MSHLKISNSRFEKKKYRANELFADAELHDVWAFELPTGRGHTLLDLREVLRESAPTRANRKVRFLFFLRRLGGKFFGLDSFPKALDPSYLEKLTVEDREKTLEEPGTLLGGFKTLYVFKNEAANEISNKVVHAISVMTMEPLPEGYTIYWAIYLKRKSAAYMTLIDPFRQKYIYPAIIDGFQRKWLAKYPQSEVPPVRPRRPHQAG